MKIRKVTSSFVKHSALALFLIPVAFSFDVAVSPSQQAVAQEEGAPQRKTKKVQSIRQKHIKKFEKINEAMEAENTAEATRLIDQLFTEKDLNNLETAYLYNFRGNICFNKDQLRCALDNFKKVVAKREGLPDGFYNQMLYIIAQVYFSQENYREALNYAQRYFKTLQDPSADAYMLIGQAHYMLKDYNKALPNVQKGIQKYVDVGSIPKEGWLNLLSSIYRQKNDYRKMVPVLKQLVQHYPKKTYLLTLGGVYNELDDQAKMAAMYQALYDQGLLTKESEIVTLGSLLLGQENPYKASEVIKAGIDSGKLKKNLKNYRLLSQSLYAAREYEDALSPLKTAAGQSGDGKLYEQLGQSYIALNRWREAEGALKNGLNKKGLRDAGQTLVSLGLVQFEQKKYDQAIATFGRASKYDSSATSANNWITYVKAEVQRLKELQAEIVISTDVEPADT